MLRNIQYILALLLVIVQPAIAQTVFNLPHAIDSAKLNNADIRAQALDIDISQTEIVTARMRPNIAVGVQSLWVADRKYLPDNSGIFDKKNTQLYYQANKYMQLPWQRHNRIDVAKKYANVAKLRYAEGLRNFSLNVGTSWIACWGYKNKIVLLEETRKNLDTLIKSNEDRFKVHKVSITDLKRIKILAAQYDLQSEITTQQYQNELLNLKLLTGSSDTLDIDLKSPIETMHFSQNMDSLVMNARDNRSDVQYQKNIIAAAESNLRLQKSLAIPSPEMGLIYNPQNGIPYFGVLLAIELPVFNRNQGEIQRAVLIKEQAKDELAGTYLQTQTDVMTAYKNFKLQKNKMQKFTGITTDSRFIMENVKSAYLQGNTDVVDFLEAERNWYSTRQLYTEALVAYYQSYLQLLYATGQIDKM